MIYHIFKIFFLHMFSFSLAHWDYIFFWGLITVVFGGRLMCCLQGDIPWNHFHKIHQGGLSVFGHIYAGLFYSLLISYIYNENPILFTESIILSTSLQIIMGRLGNYLKGELGGVYSSKLKMRHPSQIYQLCLEGIVQSAILWNFYDCVGQGIIFMLMPVVYAIFRSFCEIFKMEDSAMPDWFRRWCHRYIKFVHFQCICLPIVFAAILFCYA